MNVKIIQIPGVTLDLTIEQARSFLVDPTEIQDTVRAVLADYAASHSKRTNDLTFNEERAKPLRAGSIARAAKKQNKRFLAKRSGVNGKANPTAKKVPCSQCGKLVKDSPQGWKRHSTTDHDGEALTIIQQFDDPNPVLAADDESFD